MNNHFIFKIFLYQLKSCLAAVATAVHVVGSMVRLVVNISEHCKVITCVFSTL